MENLHDEKEKNVIKCDYCNKVFILYTSNQEGYVVCPFCKKKSYYYELDSKNSLKGDTVDK